MVVEAPAAAVIVASGIRIVSGNRIKPVAEVVTDEVSEVAVIDPIAIRIPLTFPISFVILKKRRHGLVKVHLYCSFRFLYSDVA